ncbi:MAG: Hpt domain-containing protein, partial [Porticoccaceae bacterium]|nr:Hpt domain-containing protein [Porticoccaceae bacterium]
PTPGLLRALHTLKGSALMAEVSPVSQLMEPLEGLVKDLYNFQQAVDWPLVQLLTDSVAALQNALPVLESGDQHSVVEGSDELLARIDESRQRLLPMVPGEQLDEAAADDDSFAEALSEHEPEAIDEADEASASEQAQQEFAEHLRPLIALMTDGLHQLMDAETLFAQWRDSGEQPQLETLVEEYDQLNHAAAKADEQSLAQLAAKMADTLQVADMAPVANPPAVLATLADSHDKLLVMIDALAAGQQMPAVDEQLTVLELLASDLHHQIAEPQQDTAEDAAPTESAGLPDETGAQDVEPPQLDEPQPEQQEPEPEPEEESAELHIEAEQEPVASEADETDIADATEQDDSETVDAAEGATEEPAEEHGEDASEPVEQAPAPFIPPAPVAASSDDDQFDMEVLAIFMEETGELLETIDNSVYSWREEPHINTWPDEIKRALHTFKGGARMAAQDELGDLSHNFESWLIESEHRATGDDGFFDELQQRQDELHAGVRQLAQSIAGSGQVVEADTSESSAQPTPVAADLGSVPLPQLLADSDLKAPEEMVKVSATLLDNLVNMAGETSIS